MSRDPRADWTDDPPAAHRRRSRSFRDGWNLGTDARLAALLPQLKAADALADRVADGSRDPNWGAHLDAALDAYLAARDAHLTDETSP